MTEVFIVVDLSDAELEQVRALAESRELSVERLVVQALRLYADVDAKLTAGETMHFSGDEQRAREFVGTTVESD